jgi:hypothetical protein
MKAIKNKINIGEMKILAQGVVNYLNVTMQHTVLNPKEKGGISE